MGADRFDQSRGTGRVDIEVIQSRVVLKHRLVYPAQAAMRGAGLGGFREHGGELQRRVPLQPFHDERLFIQVLELARSPVQVDLARGALLEEVAEHRLERSESSPA